MRLLLKDMAQSNEDKTHHGGLCCAHRVRFMIAPLNTHAGHAVATPPPPASTTTQWPSRLHLRHSRRPDGGGPTVARPTAAGDSIGQPRRE